MEHPFPVPHAPGPAAKAWREADWELEERQVLV